MNRESYLKSYQNFLREYIKSIGQKFIPNDKIANKIIQFKDDENHKAWTLNGIQIKHPDLNKNNHIRPRNTKLNYIELDINWGIVDDDFFSNCTIKIAGTCKNSQNERETICSFHIDTEPKSSDSPPHFSHPTYHLQYGGRHIYMLEKMMGNDEVDSFYGNLLRLDAPRLIHPPLDVILCIDFVLTYLLPIRTTAEIKSKPVYKSSISRAQNVIWKPYFNSISNYFITDKEEEKRHAKRLVPQFYARD